VNCLETRRRVLAEPSVANAGLGEHLRDCPPCGRFAARARDFDESLRRVLDVDVPAVLADSLVWMSVERVRMRRRALIAGCASLAIAATLGAASMWLQRDDPMALACIDFVVEEEANAILMSSRPDSDALRNAVNRLGIDLAPQFGSVRYIGNCLFQGTLAYHLIAATPQGKVTMLLMPERRLDAPRSGNARGLHASVVPVGSGSIVFIAESASSLERARQMVLLRSEQPA